MMESALPYLLGKETARVYLYWTSARAGLNASRVFRWGTSLVAVPIGVLTVFAVPVHTTFHEAEMRIRPYASPRSTTYRYDQILALTTTDGIKDRFGKFVPDPCILIDFDDGTKWSSGDNLRDPDRSINLDLKAFLAEKSKVPVEY